MNSSSKKPLPDQMKFLDRTLLLYIVILSTLATSIFTGISFYLDYLHEIDALENSFHQIEKTSIKSISKSVFEIDKISLETQIQGLLQIPSVIEVSIFDENTNPFYKNSNKNKNSSYPIKKKLLLFHQSFGKNHYLGTIYITATKYYLYERLKRKLIYFFLTQGLKTLLVSSALLIIFKKIVVIHLKNMARYLENFNYNANSQLVLEGERSNPNELDFLCLKINEMNSIIRKSFREKIDELKTTKKELQKQKEKIINSANLASLGEMAGGVAHEINNPLTIIYGHNRLIQRNINNDPIDKNFLLNSSFKIDKTIKRISSVVDGLLLFSRDNESCYWEYKSISELIKEVLSITDSRIKGKNIQLAIDEGLIKSNIHMYCNSTQIGQVFINLLNNSIYAVESMENRWIDLSFRMANPKKMMIDFLITDSGNGIPPEIIDKIMNPFFTTKPVGKGTGLGLSLSASIIESHKGKFYLDRNHSNTRFVISLPFQTDIPFRS